MTTEKLPPHNELAEEALISCAMQSPIHHLPLVVSKVPPEAFYVIKNRSVWQVLKSKHEDGERIDLITVAQSLQKLFDLNSLGGLEWLSKLHDLAPSPEEITEQAGIVMEMLSRRKILQSCHEITDEINQESDRNLIDGKIERLFNEGGIKQVGVDSGEGCANQMIYDLQRRFDLNGQLAGIDTGFHLMNALTDGIQYGEQTIIAARPSMGKTAIGLNIFQKAVFELKIPSLFISLEMSTAALMKRLLSSYMSIPMGDIRKGSYSKNDFGNFSRFKAVCCGVPMYVANAVSGSSIGEISSTVRHYCKRHDVKFVVIDYLQKIKASEKQEKKTYEIGDVSGRLKSLAVDTGAAMLTLAQLNRESEKDKGRMPRISDLADSGQIERDGDTIMLIHRDRSDKTGATKIIVAKQRDGEVGVVDLLFNGKFCRFENAPISDSDIPTSHND